MKPTDPKLIRLCQTLTDLTEQNAHSEARVLIADFFDYQTVKDCLEAVQLIHDTERHLPGCIAEYRAQKTNDLLNLISQDYGNEVATMIRRAI